MADPEAPARAAAAADGGRRDGPLSFLCRASPQRRDGGASDYRTGGQIIMIERSADWSGTIRVAVGIEHPDDLITDLGRALRQSSR